jgi:uncharacterized protein YqgV (UPF0045/DUF77 family)
MNITLEITMYPLHEDYKNQVLSFLNVFTGNDAFEFRVNAMSTQATGDMEALMNWVQKCISEVYEEGVKAAFIQKIFPGELDLAYSYEG